MPSDVCYIRTHQYLTFSDQYVSGPVTYMSNYNCSLIVMVSDATAKILGFLHFTNIVSEFKGFEKSSIKLRQPF